MSGDALTRRIADALADREGWVNGPATTVAEVAAQAAREHYADVIAAADEMAASVPDLLEAAHRRRLNEIDYDTWAIHRDDARATTARYRAVRDERW